METAQPQAPTQDKLSSKEGTGTAAPISVGTEVKENLKAQAKTQTENSKYIRKCIVTGEELQKSVMIRFVIGPDQVVVPDLAQNLPGRGLWVTATKDAITAATKKNLFAKAAKEPAKPSIDLADQTAALMRARVLNFLGLAKGAGIATLGQIQVESALRAKKISVLFATMDAGRDFEKLSNLLDKVTLSRLFSRDELGSALGYDQLVYVGLAGHQLTTKIRDALKLYATLADTPIETPTPEITTSQPPASQDAVSDTQLSSSHNDETDA